MENYPPTHQFTDYNHKPHQIHNVLPIRHRNALKSSVTRTKTKDYIIVINITILEIKHQK